MQHIKGIVFDLDDTLYPQKAFKRSGFAVVAKWLAKQYDYNPHLIVNELEDIMRRKGASYPYMFNDLAERLDMDESNVSLMVQVFIDHEPSINCYPGVHAMLNRLRKRFKLGLLTDGRLAVQQRKIRALGLERKVDALLCSDRIGMEKPAMQLFEWFERTLEIAGQDLMHVGDNPMKDFYGANLRRWTTVCVVTGKNQNTNRESAFKACFDIPSVIDMEKLLS